MFHFSSEPAHTITPTPQPITTDSVMFHFSSELAHTYSITYYSRSCNVPLLIGASSHLLHNLLQQTLQCSTSRSQDLEQSSTTNNCTDDLSSDTPPCNPATEPYLITTNPLKTLELWELWKGKSDLPWISQLGQLT